jgi:ABC-type transporter Mla subunit MlaD
MEKSFTIINILVNKVIYKIIYLISKKLGIDPNTSANSNIKKLSNKTKLIIDSLNTPEGRDLKNQMNLLFQNILLILEPSLNESIDVLNNNVSKLTASINKIIVSALQEIPPIFVIFEAANFLTASLQTGEIFLHFTDIGLNTLNKLRPMIKDIKELIDKFQRFIDNVIDKKDNFKGNYVKTINKYNNQKKLIGGRIQSTLKEFI